MKTSPQQIGVGYWVGIILLAAALGIGVSLFYLLIASPESTSAATFEVGAIEADECPVGDRAPACFRFAVTNTGSQAGNTTCVAVASDGTLALFPNGEPMLDVVLGSGETRQLYVKVVPEEGNEITQPGITCRAP